jgi:hypothetical protein
MARKSDADRSKHAREVDVGRKKEERRKQLRALVYSSLIGGAASMTGMAPWSNAAAHGNASSHKRAELRWNVNDFVVLRQGLLQPEDPRTVRLRSLTTRLDALARKSDVLGGSRTSLVLGNSEVGQERQKVTQEARKVQSEQEELANELRMRPITSEVLFFLRQGDEQGAVAAVEGVGSPEDVLTNYIWVQMDLQHNGRIGERSSSAFAKEILIVSGRAIQYYENLSERSEAITRAGAAIYHNLASFTLPAIGSYPEDAVARGREAAEKALELREELGDDDAIMRALWILGVHELRRGAPAGAEDLFRKAQAIAEDTAEQKSTLAWAQIYVGLSLIAREDTLGQGEVLVSEGRKVFEALGDEFTLKIIDDARDRYRL